MTQPSVFDFILFEAASLPFSSPPPPPTPQRLRYGKEHIDCIYKSTQTPQEGDTEMFFIVVVSYKSLWLDIIVMTTSSHTHTRVLVTATVI